MTDLAKQETLITALDGLLRADWDRDPRAWLSASNRLFDAVIGVSSYAAASNMGDDEIREFAAVKAAEFLCSGAN